MTDPKLSRRDFLRDTTIYGGGLWIALSLPRPLAARAAAESSQRAVLSEAEWITVEAITGRILPTDHGISGRDHDNTRRAGGGTGPNVGRLRGGVAGTGR